MESKVTFTKSKSSIVDKYFIIYHYTMHGHSIHVMYTGVIFLSADDKMVCLDPHYCQSAVDMSKDDFPTQVKNFLNKC